MLGRRLTVATLLSVVLASCGGADEAEVVCDMVRPATVARELRDAGADLRGTLRPRGDESPGLSVCSYRGGHTSVRVSRDTAPQAPLRYFHRIVEQFEFHAGDPQWEPHLVFGVGDDRRAYGGAGSYWVPAYGQLISLRDERLVVVTVSTRGASDRERRRAAERLTLRVFGGGEAAERGHSPEQITAALDVLEAKVDTFNQLVLDLLEISRLEAGVAPLDRERVDLERFTRSVLNSTGRSGVPLGVEPDAPKQALVDSRRVSQMLVNLLENADKYAGGATGLVVSGSNGVVRFAVEDRGPGIAEHERHHIFERFARGESASLPGATDGTGLGLSLVAEHARLHDGRVWVEDRPGGGARFVVELPVGEP